MKASSCSLYTLYSASVSTLSGKVGRDSYRNLLKTSRDVGFFLFLMKFNKLIVFFYLNLHKNSSLVGRCFSMQCTRFTLSQRGATGLDPRSRKQESRKKSSFISTAVRYLKYGGEAEHCDWPRVSHALRKWEVSKSVGVKSVWRCFREQGLSGPPTAALYPTLLIIPEFRCTTYTF